MGNEKRDPAAQWTPLIMRIAAMVILLALIGAAVYLVAIDRAEHIDKLYALGFIAAGIAGVVLPSVLGGKGPKVPPLPVLMLAIAVVVGVSSIGCGGSQREQHEVLNRITDVADPTYAMVLASCDAARDVIVARTGTTYEEDTAAMDAIDTVCDPLVAGLETLRGTQLTVRAAIAAGAQGAILEGLQHALQLWADLQELVPALEELGRSSGGAAQQGGVS